MQHPAVATTHQRYHIPNLKRALEVFEVLAKNTDGINLSEIALITGYSKNSIFRIICTLEDCGYVLKKQRPPKNKDVAQAGGFGVCGLWGVEHCGARNGRSAKNARRLGRDCDAWHNA